MTGIHRLARPRSDGRSPEPSPARRGTGRTFGAFRLLPLPLLAALVVAPASAPATEQTLGDLQGNYSAQRTVTFDGTSTAAGTATWALSAVPTRGDTLSPASRLHVVLENLDPRFDYTLSIGEVKLDPIENAPFEFDDSAATGLLDKRVSGVGPEEEASQEVRTALQKKAEQDLEACKEQTAALASGLAGFLNVEEWDAARFRSWTAGSWAAVDLCAQAAERRPSLVEAAEPSADGLMQRALRKRLSDIVQTLSRRDNHRRWEQDFGPWRANVIISPTLVYRRAVPAVADGDALVSALSDELRAAAAKKALHEGLAASKKATAEAAGLAKTLRTRLDALQTMLTGAASSAPEGVKGKWTKWRDAVAGVKANLESAASQSSKAMDAAAKAAAGDASASTQAEESKRATQAIKEAITELGKVNPAVAEAPEALAPGEAVKAALSEASLAYEAASKGLEEAKTATETASKRVESDKPGAADPSVDPGEAGRAEVSLYVVRARVIRADAGIVISFMHDPKYSFANGILVDEGSHFQVHGALFFGHYWAPRAFYRPMRHWERFVPTVQVGISVTAEPWENLFLGLAWEPVRDVVFTAGAHLGPVDGLPEGLSVGDSRPVGFKDGDLAPRIAQASVSPFFAITVEGSLFPKLFGQNTPAVPAPAGPAAERDAAKEAKKEAKTGANDAMTNEQEPS